MLMLSNNLTAEQPSTPAGGPRLPISVAMISAAEASRIGRALESVAGWTSEIVVVLNAGVQDGTEEIARRHGARVFREPWKGFVLQKTSAAAKTTGEWILGLDADEVVSPRLREEIHRTFSEPAGLARYAAFSYPRLSWYCGRWIRHGDWYPDRQTRLWRRGRGSWGGIDPHDKVQVDGLTGKLRGDLYHYSNDSINRHVQKIIPFSDEFVQQHAPRRRGVGMFDLVARPSWRFVRAYFLRLGFLDGWPGYYIAWLNAFATLTRYAKIRELRSSKLPPDRQERPPA
jgi:glycosyltransferase involved in cell wall biosynthesis